MAVGDIPISASAQPRTRHLLDPATEEFLRFYTPAPGDGRTISADVEIDGTEFKEGERLWLSWAMANRDPAVFDNPNEIILDRKGNRHFSFGLGVHRCIGSNVARAVFKSMLTAVLDRMPDFVCDPEGAVHYDTIGVIKGMKHLPATFTPGKRSAPASTRHWRNCSGSATSRNSPGRSPSARKPPLSTETPTRCSVGWFDRQPSRRDGTEGLRETPQAVAAAAVLTAAATVLAPPANAMLPLGNYDVLTNRYDPGVVGVGRRDLHPREDAGLHRRQRDSAAEVLLRIRRQSAPCRRHGTR